MTDTSSTSPASIFKPVIAGLARHAFTAAAGALASYGLIQPDQEAQFEDGGVAVALFLAGVAWSYWQKRQAVKPAVPVTNKLQMLGPIAFLMATGIGLSGCSALSSVDPLKTLYALDGTYTAAATAEANYCKTSVADASVCAKMKDYDNKAFAALQPLTQSASQPNATIHTVALAAAESAVTAFTSYVTSHQVTK